MPDTLAQKIRAKFPGVYDDLSDTDLESKITAKYPGVYDDITKTATGGTTATTSAATPTAVTPPRTYLDTAEDVAKGFAKGAARTVLGAGELVNMIPGVQSTVDRLYGQPGLSAQAFKEAHQATAATNTPQMVGKGLETAAEFALPVGKVAESVPTAAKAGAKFQDVMGAAKNFPVDVNAPGEVALRIQQLAERGSSMPMVVRKFLTHITDPEKPPMTYEVARDFASNISRLSSQEYQRLTPVVAREVAGLRVALNKSVADAAKAAGKGAEYAQAMSQYARAMKIRDAVDAAIAGAKKAVLPAALVGGAAGAGYWVTKQLKDLLD